MEQILSVNEEAIRAWDGPLFDRFVQFRHLLTEGLGAHGDAALEVADMRPGEHVLDIGCGFGDTTQTIAGLVGPTGDALGVDAASRFIEAARSEAAQAGVANASFLVEDMEAASLPQRFDQAYSRMGTMFFANPVTAFATFARPCCREEGS